MLPEIKLNQEYTKEEIEHIFNTNFGSRIKGITLRKWEGETPYIILFSKVNGPYTDRIEGDVFYYDGEGIAKDQQLTPANRALLTANESGRIIYGFQQEEQKKWKYVGILKVLDYEYIEKSGYKVYEFKLQKTSLSNNNEENQESKEILQLSIEKEPTLTSITKLSASTRKARDAFFSRKVKEIYDFKCAFCKKRRFTKAKYPEVESAHIYPKEKDGSDDLRNGIPLCKLHHWAFDGGLMCITDDYTIKISEDIKGKSDYLEITSLEGQNILEPSEKAFTPHKKFIGAHRKIHSFE